MLVAENCYARLLTRGKIWELSKIPLAELVKYYNESSAVKIYGNNTRANDGYTKPCGNVSSQYTVNSKC